MENQTQNASEDARPDVACSAGLGRGELRRRAIRDGAAAAHRIWCGTPPSCGQEQPCRASEINPRDVAAIVDATLALALPAKQRPNAPKLRRSGRRGEHDE